MAYTQNIIGFENHPGGQSPVETAPKRRTIEAQPKLDRGFRQRFGEFFLRALYGKNGLMDVARQQSVAPRVPESPAGHTVKWEVAQGVSPVIEAPQPLGQAPRPEAQMRAVAAMPQETQPDYSQAQEIKARVGVDIPRSTTTEYRGRLVGDETSPDSHTETPEK